MSHKNTSEVWLVGLTGQLYPSHISVQGNDVKLFFISGFSLWQHWPLVVLPDFHFSALYIMCRHNGNCSVEISRTQSSHGEEKKGQITAVIMLKERVCACVCVISQHTCDFRVCVYWIAVRVGRDAQTDSLGNDVCPMDSFTSLNWRGCTMSPLATVQGFVAVCILTKLL